MKINIINNLGLTLNYNVFLDFSPSKIEIKGKFDLIIALFLVFICSYSVARFIQHRVTGRPEEAFPENPRKEAEHTRSHTAGHLEMATHLTAHRKPTDIRSQHANSAHASLLWPRIQ